MSNTQLTDRLVQTWVEVTDRDGRTHLEARWTTVRPAHSAHAA